MKRFLKNSFCLLFSFASLMVLSSCTIKNKDIKKIGIIQLVEHDALDSAYKGFIDGLYENGYSDGENIKIDYQNAQGDQSNCFTAINKLLNNQNDLIFAISTPAAQAALAATKKVPIIFTAVTDPFSAGLTDSISNPISNITGTSDLSPIDKQIELIKIIKPNLKKLAILYCSNEANSKYQADIAFNHSKAMGIDTEIFTVSQISEIDQALQIIINKCDFIYTPTDNMIASSMPTISKIALSAKIPIICGDYNVVSKGALGTYGIDYYELGKMSAAQAIDIIYKNKSPSDIPISYISEAKLTLNLDIINNLKIEIPEEILKKANIIHTELS